MFSKAYVKVKTEQGGSHRNKFKTQTLKMICVGKCPKSDSILFYHPASKQLLSDADGHRFDNFSPSGPQFDLKYDGSLVMSRKSDLPTHQQLAHELNDSIFVKTNNKYSKATILTIPINDDEDTYTVQHKDTGKIEQVPQEDLVDHDPTTPISDESQPLNPK